MRIKTICVLSAVLVAGCSKGEQTKSDESGKDVAEDGSDTTAVGEVNIETDPLSALNLSASLSPEVPKSVSASGDGVDSVESGQVAVQTLTAAEREKSREACHIRQNIREAKMNQEQIAMQLCFIEAQKGMKAGGKYKMKFKPPNAGGGPGGEPPAPSLALDPMFPGGMEGGGTEGPDLEDMENGPTGTMTGTGTGTGTGGTDMEGFEMPAAGEEGGGPEMPSELDMAVFLDNSDAAAFKVFVCMDGKLAQKVVVEGAGSTGSKGSFKVKQEMSGMGSVQIQGAFDNGVTEAGHSRSISQNAFEMGESNILASIEMDLVKDGISTVKMAHEGADGMDFSKSSKKIGAALIGPNLGAALLQSQDDGDSKATTNRAYFDSAGQTLEKENAEAFDEGGDLYVTEDLLPKLTAEDFKVEFEATDWDCQGAEDFTMEENDAFETCAEKFMSPFEFEMCDDFAAGPPAKGIDSQMDNYGTPDDAMLPGGQVGPSGEPMQPNGEPVPPVQ